MLSAVSSFDRSPRRYCRRFAVCEPSPASSAACWALDRFDHSKGTPEWLASFQVRIVRADGAVAACGPGALVLLQICPLARPVSVQLASQLALEAIVTSWVLGSM